MKKYLTVILVAALFQIGSTVTSYSQDVLSAPHSSPKPAGSGVQPADIRVPEPERGIVEATRENLWPKLGLIEWYWHVPNENLSEKEAKAAVSSVESGFYFNPTGNHSGQLKGVEVSKKWLKFKFVFNGRDAVQSVPMKIFRGVGGLFYATDQQRGQKWVVTVLLNTTSKTPQVYFKTEALGRSFIKAVLSCAKLAGKKIESPGVQGLRFSDLTPAQAQALGKDRTDSALVNLVALDGPADRAGLRFLDIITEVNGAKIRHADQLAEALEAAVPGTVMKLSCLARTQETGASGVTYIWKPKSVELIVE